MMASKRSRSDTDRNAISYDAEDDIERSSACKKKSYCDYTYVSLVGKLKYLQ